jgi:hypothetical protein
VSFPLVVLAIAYAIGLPYALMVVAYLPKRRGRERLVTVLFYPFFGLRALVRWFARDW